MTSYSPERLARAGLTRIFAPGERRPDSLRGMEPVEQWEALRTHEVGHEAWRSRVDLADPQRDLERIEQAGGRFLIPSDPEWPEQLAALQGTTWDGRPGDAPVGLWVRGRGNLKDLTARSVAIVGSRASTAYGEKVAGDMAGELVEQGVTVVSGGAFGIDAAAHRYALAARGRVPGTTVAVLACGADRAYPTANTRMFEDIVRDGGLVVSESAPGSAPDRTRFMMRNRIIAGLALGTVIVEATLRSGTMNTVRWTEQILRPVMAMPGPVTSISSSGTNQLIKDGRAVLVRTGADVLKVLG